MKLIDIQTYEYIDICLKSSNDWYTTEILNVINDKTMIITLPDNLKGFFVSDELKCRITDGKDTYIFDAEIYDVIFKHPQALVLFVPGQIKKFDKYRKEKRYSVSFLTEIYKLKSFYGCVKDISIKGICFNSKGYLDKGDEIAVTLYFDDGKQFVFFEGRVVRKIEQNNFREYGIEIENIKSEELDKYISLIDSLEKQVYK